jgi:hypothetical protein
MGLLRRRERGEDPGNGLLLRPGGLRVADAVVPLWSAGFPYWEIAPGHWERALASLLAVGFRLIRLDVPWGLHERGAGEYEWGARRPELHVARVLELARRQGLLALVRPGPTLGDVAPHGGLPERFSPERAAPAPGADGYRSAARAWLAEVVRVVEPQIHPAGPIVGWIASTSQGSPAPGGGALERTDEGIALFRRQLAASGASAPASAAPPPADGPTRADEVEPAIAWVEAGQVALRTALAEQLAARPHARGEHALDRMALPALAFVDDEPAGSGVAPGHARSDADGAWLVAPPGLASEWSEIRLLGLRAAEAAPAAGVALLATARSLFERAPRLDPPTVAAALAMCGVRSLDVAAPIARRGRAEAGAPLRADGSLDDAVAARWREALRMLDAISHASLRRRPRALLLANHELGCLREACRLRQAIPLDVGPAQLRQALALPPRELGLRERVELEADLQLRALFDGLRRASIPLAVADSSLAAARLADFPLAIVPSFERMGRATAQRLFEWTAAGGTLVIGPRFPREDWSGAPFDSGLRADVKERVSSLRFAGLELRDVDLLAGGEPLLEVAQGTLAASYAAGRGRVVLFGFRLPWGAAESDADALAEIARRLASAADVAPAYAPSDPTVESELHEGVERRFLFLANPSDAGRAVTIALRPSEALREVRGSAVHARAGDVVQVPARSVILREVVKL